MKFKGYPNAQATVRGQKSPSMAACFGRSPNMPRRPDWDKVKDDVMREALQLKFDQHPKLEEQLLATREWNLVEKSRKDLYWGDGGNGTGKNRLGKMLEELREKRYIRKMIPDLTETNTYK